jgi:putative intracellular protease/amidase
MKEVLFVILQDYADWESAHVAAAINDSREDGGDFIVKTVSLSKQPVRSIGGFTTLPDYDLSTAPERFAALLLIGGKSWRKKESEPVAGLVSKAVEMGVPVGAICDATVFLGMHGFLNDVKHTSNMLNDLKAAAKENYTNERGYIEEQAVSDGGIITANGTAYMEFAKEVLISLKTINRSSINEWYDYFKFGHYEALKKLAASK